MDQEASTALYLRRALAIGLAYVALRQFKFYRLSYLFPVSLNDLADEIDKAFIFFLNVNTLFFSWCVAEASISDASAITNLNALRCTLTGFILTLTIFGDSLLKRVFAGFAIGACWMLGWTITSVEQRASCGEFLTGGLFFALVDIWRKISR